MNKFIKIFTVLFFLIILSSCSNKEYKITYMVNDDIYDYEDDVFSKSLNFVLPQVDGKDGYLYDGWYDSDDFSGNKYLTTRTLPKKDITLYVKWKVDETAMNMKLNKYKDMLLQQSLDLPKTIDNFNITYESSNTNIISNDGTLQRDYEESLVELVVNYIDKDTNELAHKTIYPIRVSGYKTLDKPIRASYLYRSYETVDQAYFDSLDIVYASFALANEQGIITRGAYFNDAKKIIKKGKEDGVRVIMSVGPSSSWNSFSKTQELREAFSISIVEVINEYGFDGVDIDWETPTTAQSNDYVELMKEVYTRVKQNNPNHLVTTAITAGPYQPPRYNLRDSGQYIDYINLMAYGMINGNAMYQNALFDSTTNHNTTLNVGKTIAGVSIDKTIPLLNSFGISNSKIIVGLAFYGISHLNNNGTWVNYGSIAYHNIYSNLVSGLYKEYYDEVAQVPYAIKNDGSIFISYDNPKSIKAKANYVIENNLAGLMYWEHHHDNTRILLDALTNSLRP